MLALNKLLAEWLKSIISNASAAEKISTLITGFLILIIAFLLLIVVRKILIATAHKFAEKTKNEWDDVFIKNKFVLGLAHLFPAAFIYFSSNFASLFFDSLDSIFLKLGETYFLFSIVFLINSFLSSVNEIYNKTFSFAKERPISGFVQLLKIFMYIVAVLIMITIVFDKELGKLLTGLGAMTAIIMLIFKDTILGFVASIQISMYNMVKVGDWIAMSSRGADGEITEINLTTVKVQNWDKTLAMIPTYALISESFINWKGMEQSGGRRIKRSININMHSVKFCSQEMLEKFQKFALIKDYVVEKQNEIEEFNKKLNVAPEENYNGRRQTNLGIFRKYLEAYLHNHPQVREDMTFLVRHLQPTEEGIPIEIYVFSKDQRWAYYEAIQADIFDHILAVIPEFELSVFQNPSGDDFSKFLNKN